MTKPSMPQWAQRPDPEFLTALERMRRKYAWHLDTKPVLLWRGTPDEEPLTVELMLLAAERRAADELD